MIVVDGSRHRNDVELCFLELGFISSEIDGRRFDRLIADLVGRIDAAFVKLDLLCIKVKAYNVNFLGKGDRDRHTDIAKSHQGELFFFVK